MFRFSAASIWVIAFVVCFLPVSGGCGGGPGDSADTMVDAWPDTRVDVPPTDLALDDVEGADSVPDTSCGDICFDDASFGDVSLDATVDVDAGDVVEPPVLCPAFDSRFSAGVLDSTPLNEVSGLRPASGIRECCGVTTTRGTLQGSWRSRSRIHFQARTWSSTRSSSPSTVTW